LSKLQKSDQATSAGEETGKEGIARGISTFDENRRPWLKRNKPSSSILVYYRFSKQTVTECLQDFRDMRTRYPLPRAKISTFPKASSKKPRNLFPAILDLTTIWKRAFRVMCPGASETIVFTVSIPALTGGFESTQSNTISSIGS
jgi:hypothetical protein